jgi:hypothetical protein
MALAVRDGTMKLDGRFEDEIPAGRRYPPVDNSRMRPHAPQSRLPPSEPGASG